MLDKVAAANVGWKSLFATKGNRRRLRVIVAIAFFSQWSGNGLLSYCDYFLSPFAVLQLMVDSIRG